jgi:REP element-mobilizing transposase RayT
MARPLRIEVENGLYHVTCRGWERREIVRDDMDRESWLDLLDRVALRCGWRVFAWVLMTNHWHLFLRTPQPNLSAGMHDLNSGYATRYNRRHKRVGSLYQGRFKAILVEDESHAAGLSRYIHLNPVRARMVVRPQDYAWSSYRHYLSARPGPEWLDTRTVLAEIGQNVQDARAAYRRFVERGTQEPSPLDSVVGGMLLGSVAWVERMRKELGEQPESHDVPTLHRLAWRPSVEVILEVVSHCYGVDESAILERRRRGNDARLAALCLCRRLTDERVGRLAARFGGVSTAAITKAVTRGEIRCSTDRRWDRHLSDLTDQIKSHQEAPLKIISPRGKRRRKS